MSVFVIAEAAVTYRFGDDHLANAKRLIEACKAAGADAWKTQWTSSAARIAERRHAPEYLAAYERLQFPREWLTTLKGMCDEAGLKFGCTVYLQEDVAAIRDLVDFFKIASFEATDRPFIDAHPHDRVTIISHGMDDCSVPQPREGPYRHLHCVSAYPCPTEQLNLRRIVNDLDSESGYDGLSDHTTSTLTGAVAVGAGAEIIEKHVRMNDTPTSDPDYSTALNAEDMCYGQIGYYTQRFSEYVANIREAERMMGTGEQGAMECEKAMMRLRVGGGK